MNEAKYIKTIYGTYTVKSKPRLELTYDYEHGTVISFIKITEAIGASMFFDIGANIGCYTVSVGEIPCMERVLSFEPAPEAFKELELNVAIQENKDKISLFNMALSDENKTAQFLIVSPMAGNNRLDDAIDGGDKKNHIDVPCKTLDSMLSLKDKTIAIKVDVEGHEIHTLSGMTNILKNNNCLLQVECLEEPLVIQVKELLRTLGFELLFALRDDYIFISGSLTEAKEKLQDIYFKTLQDDFRELLKLRKLKRAAINNGLDMLMKCGYPYNPIAKE